TLVKALAGCVPRVAVAQMETSDSPPVAQPPVREPAQSAGCSASTTLPSPSATSPRADPGPDDETREIPAPAGARFRRGAWRLVPGVILATMVSLVAWPMLRDRLAGS